MFKINCLNPISDVGLKNFNDKYEVTDDVKEAQANPGKKCFHARNGNPGGTSGGSKSGCRSK